MRRLGPETELLRHSSSTSSSSSISSSSSSSSSSNNRWRRRKKVFVPKRTALIGDWRKFRIEELHYLCTSPDFVQKIK
jgi:hypothetical protein